MPEQSNIVLYAALAANLGVTITKFIAAGMSGSSAMLTEAFHSTADTSNSVLLLIGRRMSARAPDELHPFGHGKELYFYSVIVAVMIFGIGGGAAIYEGIRHVLAPSPAENAGMNYIVLGVAALLEGGSWYFAVKDFRHMKGKRSVVEAVRRSKDPASLTVFFEDGAALAGLGIAALGIFCSERLGMPVFDGAASIVIGALLCAVATILLKEGKNLLIGEAAIPEVRSAICERVQQDPAVSRTGRLMTMQLGPEQILVNLEVRFHSGLGADDIHHAVERLEQSIRDVEPHVSHVFIEAASLAGSGRAGHEQMERARSTGSQR